MKIKKVSKNLLVNLIVFFAILVSIEIFSFLIFEIWLWRKGDNLELVESWEFELNPSIGHTHTDKSFKKNSNSKNSISNNNIYTEKVYGNGEKQFKLIILGGSSSDALGTKFSGINKTWPDFLGEKISIKTGKQVKIYNAAVGGGTSSQEFRRLSLLLYKIKPDLIVSFNGINEIYFTDKIFKNKDNIYASSMVLNGFEQNLIKYKNGLYCKYICLPKFSKLKTVRLSKVIKSRFSRTIDNQINYLTDHSLSKKDLNSLEEAGLIWKHNIYFMNAISNQKDIKYLEILQPTFGLDISNTEIDNLIKKELQDAHYYRREIFKKDNRYYLKINALYSELRTHCHKMNFCFDMSKMNSLNNNTNLLNDPRHHNSLGNNLIAEIIVDKIIEFNLIPN